MCNRRAGYTRNVIEEFKKLGLAVDEYALIGSSVLELHGIRPARDIDFVGLPKVLHDLRRRGWKTKRFFWGWPFRQAVQSGDFECYSNVKYRSHRPETEEIISRADVIDGVSYMSLADLAAFKLALGREKDLNDIRLIDVHAKEGKCPICAARA